MLKKIFTKKNEQDSPEKFWTKKKIIGFSAAGICVCVLGLSSLLVPALKHSGINKEYMGADYSYKSEPATYEADSAYGNLATGSEYSQDCVSEEYAIDSDYVEKPAQTEESGSYEGEAAREDITYQEMKIKTWYIEISTEDYDQTMSMIKTNIPEYNGYVDSENEQSYRNSQRNNNMVIRVPAEKAEELVAELEKSGTVTSKSSSQEDVTYEYIDVDSRIRALRTEQKTLEGLMEQSADIEVILKVQKELTDVNHEIERFESQKRYLSNRVSYSSIEVYVQETIVAPEVEYSFGGEIREAFRSSLVNLSNSVLSIIIFVTGHWVGIIILIVVIVIVRSIIRRKRIRKAEKAETISAATDCKDSEDNN